VPITCGPNKKRAGGGAEEGSARATCTGSSDSGEAGEAVWFIGELASPVQSTRNFTRLAAGGFGQPNAAGSGAVGPNRKEGGRNAEPSESGKMMEREVSEWEGSESPRALESEERERRKAI